MPAQRHLHWIAPLVLLALAAAIYLPSLPREFVLDSRTIVSENEQLKPGTNPLALFANTYWGLDQPQREYRPATLLSFWVEKNLLGFSQPWTFAVVNILLHAMAAWLLWLLVWRWTGQAMAAGVAAALFVTHPIATEAVPNLVGRADLLATGFALGALLAWERRTDAQRWRWAWLAVGLWLLGLFCKESVAVLPFVAMLRDAQRFGRHAPWRTWSVWPIAGVVWLACRAAVLGQASPAATAYLINPTVGEPLPVRWMTAVDVWARYVRLMIWPQWQSAEYAYDQVPLVRSPLNGWFLAGLLLLAACVATIARTWRRRPIVAAGLTLMLLAWLLVSNIPVAIGTLMGDRLMYLPLAGLCAAVGAAAGSARRARLVIAAAAVCVVALGVRSGLRAPVWRDELTLWAQTVQDAPRNARTMSNYAKVLAATDIDAAETLLHRAVELTRPVDPAESLFIANNLGTLYLQKADLLDDDPQQKRACLDQAEHWFNYALAGEAHEGRRYERWLAMCRWQEAHGRLVPQAYGEWELHLNLSSLALQRGQPDRAIAEMRTAVAISPGQVGIHERLAKLLREQGRPREAIEVLRRIVKLKPDARSRWADLATLESSQGDLGAALDAADHVLKLLDDDAAAQLLMTIYNEALNRAAGAKDAAAMRAIAKQAADRHRIRIDLPDDLEAQLNAAPTPPAPPSPAQ